MGSPGREKGRKGEYKKEVKGKRWGKGGKENRKLR